MINLTGVKKKKKTDKKDFNDIDIYYLGYERKKKITECDKINCVNPLYLRIKDMKGQFKKGKADNVWYLTIFGDADVLKRSANVFKNMRAEIVENTGGIVWLDKNYTSIEFESNDDLPVDNFVDMHLIMVIIRIVFTQNSKFYPQLFLNVALYDV